MVETEICHIKKYAQTHWEERETRVHLNKQYSFSESNVTTWQLSSSILSLYWVLAQGESSSDVTIKISIRKES